MKIKLSIQQKIQFFIITSALVIYLVAIGFVSFRAKNKAFRDATLNADLYVKEAAQKVKAEMDADMVLTRTLAKAFHTYKNFNDDSWKEIFSNMFYEVFTTNNQIYSLWDSWELSVIDSSWSEPTGRRVNVYWRENGEVKQLVERRSIGGDPELYAKIKRMTNDAIWEPYFDVFTEGKAEKKLMTSFSSPMIINGRYTGIVAIDIVLDRFQEMVNEIQPFEGSYAYLISNTGLIAGHPNEINFNKQISELFPNDIKEHRVFNHIREGKQISYISKDAAGIQTYYSYYPINISGTTTPWSIAVAVPVSTIMDEANRNFRISLMVGVIGLLLMAIIISLISRSITNPISKITNLLKELAKGRIDDKMLVTVDTSDEIAEMAEALNTSVSGLISKQEFAKSIGTGDLESSIELLGDHDALGQALIEMRDSLITAKDEEAKRQIEDEKRRWANEGVALFSEILRQNNDNVINLSNEIIKNLVKYLKANQGGLFIFNDDDPDEPHFELVAAFAFDRKKFLTKTIEPGEGLVGTCALERQTIYMTNLPQDYIEITSGLGGANPESLLLVPLSLEESVLGVVEIASFTQFEKHEIEFVERIAQSIASTLSSVKINQRTNLLLEQTQQQAEEMAAQEEEMRQNMEELQATQEEAARKSIEMEGFMNALNISSYVIQYDTGGHIIDINEAYLELLGVKKDQVIGSHHSDDMQFTKEQEDNYNQFWDDLKRGKTRREKSRFKVNSKTYVFIETYSPILDENGDVMKILKIAQNVTDFEKE